LFLIGHFLISYRLLPRTLSDQRLHRNHQLRFLQRNTAG